MENTMNSTFVNYLSDLIGSACERESDAVNIANHVCVLAPHLHQSSFVESTKKSWHTNRELPMLEHYGVNRIKEYSHE
jgi:hypothetical protein